MESTRLGWWLVCQRVRAASTKREEGGEEAENQHGDAVAWSQRGDGVATSTSFGDKCRHGTVGRSSLLGKFVFLQTNFFLVFYFPIFLLRT